MTDKKQSERTFEYYFNLKEKKVQLVEYIILKKAFLEGLLITKEWLENFKKYNQDYNERIDKTLDHLNFESIDHELRLLDTLRSEETSDVFKFIDSQVVLRPSVVSQTTKINSEMTQTSSSIVSPTLTSIKELKTEINNLYQHEENYELCLTKTEELLRHQELSDEDKNRYNTFYHELLEWVNLKNKKREKESQQTLTPAPNQPKPVVFESRGTSISQLRTDMLKELDKLRKLYIDNPRMKLKAVIFDCYFHNSGDIIQE